jgi:hypothetical protein
MNDIESLIIRANSEGLKGNRVVAIIPPETTYSEYTLILVKYEPTLTEDVE